MNDRFHPASAQALTALGGALPGRQTILVTGATGFIGQHLIAALIAAGHAVIALARDASRARKRLPGSGIQIISSLSNVADEDRIDAVVNLAGEPISNGVWTAAKRARIVNSRVDMTRDVVRLIDRLAHKPVMISGSAVGWYGLRGDDVLTEESGATPCFSHDICQAWEHEALKATGTRTVLLRTGLVLGRGGGMLARLITPFRLGLGGAFGDGRHWMSWIHLDDLVGMILHAIARPEVSGVLNGTAPYPVTNRDFVKALGDALHRPAWLTVPAWPLRVVLGDLAHELLLSGQRVVPQAALRQGFGFRHAMIGDALANLVGREC